MVETDQSSDACDAREDALRRCVLPHLRFHISSVFYVHAFSFEAGARMVVRVCVGEFVSAIEAT